ncbi:hypothetical protein Tco_1201172 [Tanacetum coccineum]
MSTTNQQTLAELGASYRPLNLEKGSYVPWASQFLRFLDNKKEEGELMRHSIDKGPYKRKDNPDPNNDQRPYLKHSAKFTVVMSADSVVTYTSVHSEARSWSIPSEDPYEEAVDSCWTGTTSKSLYLDPNEAGGSSRPLWPIESIIVCRDTYEGPGFMILEREDDDSLKEMVNIRMDSCSCGAEIEGIRHCRALEARVTVLETDARRHEWQRQAADDLVVQYIMRTQALEAGARVDTLEDTGSSS